MPEHRQIATALMSDTGLVRSNNEDVVAEDPQIGLLVLADGMGGHNAGEVAAGIATATVIQRVRSAWPHLDHGARDAGGHRVEALLLKSAVEQAHRTICDVSQAQPQCAGMATTVVACLVLDTIVAVAHVGDSRVYRFREGELQQITHDHSLLEELVARGLCTREEAARRVRKNIVTRALGVDDEVQVDLIEQPLLATDVFLLCSDGLTDMVDDPTIAAILADAGADLDRAAQALVHHALEAGGKDNVSVVLARAEAARGEDRRWYERLLGRR